MSTGTAVDEDAHRCRRMSTASSCGEMDAAAEAAMPMEAVPAHTHLVDISLSCLSLLLALSPGLPSLLTGAALVDPDRYEPLLVASFANPTLEEQQLQQPQQHQQLSYGTLLALANTSVRSITRCVHLRAYIAQNNALFSPHRLPKKIVQMIPSA